MGDHPPIVPLRAPGKGEIFGQQKRIYDYVCQHFIAPLDGILMLIFGDDVFFGIKNHENLHVP